MLLRPKFVLGMFLKERREAMNLSRKQLAEKIGYKNTSKGIRRIETAEDGFIHPEILKKLVYCLNITENDLKRCEEEEEPYLRSLAAKMPPFKPVLIWRAMACLYIAVKIPEELTEREDIMAFASNYAKQRHSKCCLKFDYDLRYWINEEGEVPPADRSFTDLPFVRIK